LTSHRGRVEIKMGHYSCRPHGPDGDGDLSMDDSMTLLSQRRWRRRSQALSRRRLRSVLEKKKPLR
jgi:hypothetical protein